MMSCRSAPAANSRRASAKVPAGSPSHSSVTTRWTPARNSSSVAPECGEQAENSFAMRASRTAGSPRSAGPEAGSTRGIGTANIRRATTPASSATSASLTAWSAR